MPHLRIAVIGAGAAGLYTSDLLMRCSIPLHVDLIDAAPTPLGLDLHYRSPRRTKSTVRVLGNVAVNVDKLRPLYDAVIVADFTHDFAAQFAVSTAVFGPSHRTDYRDVTDYLDEQGVPYTEWLEALDLPTGRSLADWRHTLKVARGVPVCI